MWSVMRIVFSSSCAAIIVAVTCPTNANSCSYFLLTIASHYYRYVRATYIAWLKPCATDVNENHRSDRHGCMRKWDPKLFQMFTPMFFSDQIQTRCNFFDYWMVVYTARLHAYPIDVFWQISCNVDSGANVCTTDGWCFTCSGFLRWILRNEALQIPTETFCVVDRQLRSQLHAWHVCTSTSSIGCKLMPALAYSPPPSHK